MEISNFIHSSRLYKAVLCTLLSLFITTEALQSQSSMGWYTVKKGRMNISLAKGISAGSLDSFIVQYQLEDLPLKYFFETGRVDSIMKMGWKVEVNNADVFVISKPIDGYDKLDNPANKILFTEKHGKNDPVFPSVSSNIRYGYNRFRNKNSFRTTDSLVTFFLRNNTWARQVILSGSFSNWSTSAIPMQVTDSGWIATIRLSPGKYWYKFIVDGNWVVDRDNIVNENDGLGNINSVFFKTNYTVTLDSFTNAGKVYLSGSFNDWKPSELEMKRTSRGWALPLYLAEGTHTYRFIVDGKWIADPFNTEKFPNEYKDFNSVIRIGKPYVFRLDGHTENKEVVLAGSFNKWRTDELFMKKGATGWDLSYTLGPGNYEYNIRVDGKWTGRPDRSKNGDNHILIIEPNYTFRLKGFKEANRVCLAGDFNDWSPNGFAMKREGEEWVLSVHLFPGKHLYKFVVDGKWIFDPGNTTWEQNEHNTGNSVIWIEPYE